MPGKPADEALTWKAVAEIEGVALADELEEE